MTPEPSTPRCNNPFDLRSRDAYCHWRDRKLERFTSNLDDLQVEVRNPGQLSENEIEALAARCRRANLAVYSSRSGPLSDKAAAHRMGNALGLNRLDANLYSDQDAISSIEVNRGSRKGEYVPYTNRGLSWHTDGYYNRPEQNIQAWCLHCVRPAAEGGMNLLVDHEIAYIRLREQDPAYIEALMAPDAMTIPPNIENGVEIRPAQSGPVFSINEEGKLHMRYSARARNIIWADDNTTTSAVNYLNSLLSESSDWRIEFRLEAGQGVISNNVLHNRTGFRDPDDAPGRLIYRARYFDRIANT